MRRAVILAWFLLCLAGLGLAQRRPSPPPRPLTFSLSGGLLVDTGRFVREVGTRPILVPRFWISPARGLTLGLEATIMKDPASDTNRATAWPGLIANIGGGGGAGLGLGLVLPILDSEVRSPRFKLSFGFRPGPVVIHAYVIQRFRSSLNSLLGLDVGVGF